MESEKDMTLPPNPMDWPFSSQPPITPESGIDFDLTKAEADKIEDIDLRILYIERAYTNYKQKERPGYAVNPFEEYEIECCNYANNCKRFEEELKYLEKEKAVYLKNKEERKDVNVNIEEDRRKKILGFIEALSNNEYNKGKTLIPKNLIDYFKELATNLPPVPKPVLWNNQYWSLYIIIETFINNDILSNMTSKDIPEFMIQYFKFSRVIDKKGINDSLTQAKTKGNGDRPYMNFTVELKKVCGKFNLND